MTPIRVLFVCAEFAPLAKVGGLADMAAGLAGFLAKQGHDVRVLLPHYGGVNERSIGPSMVWPAAADGRARDTHPRVGFWRETTPNRAPTVYRLFCPELYSEPEIYAGGDDGRRFFELCAAAMALPDALSWKPDVVHCHDWQTALVPVLMKQPGAPLAPDARSVLTVHNLGYQGVFDAALLEAAGFEQLDGLEVQRDDATGTPQLNLLASGIRQADAVTTVSPTYAREIQTETYGMGLHHLISAVSDKLTGILNGVDYAEWNPETDGTLYRTYSEQDLSGKQDNKQRLCRAVGLSPAGDSPLIGLVSRLVQQKGIDFILEALPELLERHAFDCVFLGDGDPTYVAELRQLSDRYRERVVFVQGYDESLAHRIIAGSDALLVPSRYEPCGLTQLYALRYGTVPVVRATGGLADTVQHFDAETGAGNGCVFEHANAEGFSWALATTLEWLGDSHLRSRLIHNGMTADFSWQRQGPLYESLYSSLT